MNEVVFNTRPFSPARAIRAERDGGRLGEDFLPRISLISRMGTHHFLSVSSAKSVLIPKLNEG